LGFACLGAAGLAQAPPERVQGPSMPVLQFAPPGRTPYGYVPGQISDVCFTVKGSCNLLKPQPIGGRCDCTIPGYGRRKGIVQP
jgi:hypothetical protein